MNWRSIFREQSESAMMARWAGVPTTIGFDQPVNIAPAWFNARTVEDMGYT